MIELCDDCLEYIVCGKCALKNNLCLNCVHSNGACLNCDGYDEAVSFEYDYTILLDEIIYKNHVRAYGMDVDSL